MADDHDERTEKPTPRRRQQWRLRGQVARSAQLVGAVVLLGTSAGLTMLGGALAAHLLTTLEQQLHTPTVLQVQPQRIMQQTRMLLGGGLLAVLPVLALVVLLAVAANLLQFGFLLAPHAIKPQWSRLSPAQVCRRVFSAPGLLGVGLTLVKVLVIVTVAALLLWRELPALRLLARLSPREIADYTGTSLGAFALRLSAALSVFAVVDYALQRWRHGRSLRMTRDELRDDERQREGDPLVRKRRHAVRSSLSRCRGDHPEL